MNSELSDRFWTRLGRMFPWLGTYGVIKAVVLLNALTFLLMNLEPRYAEKLVLIPELIMQGEVWRLVTYIFVPQTPSWFWMIFFLLFMWFLADGLEQYWGSLKLNAFYFLGMIGSTIAAFAFGGGPSNTFLNLSLFFAFATVAPNYEIFLFFILRIKIKYLAWVLAGIYALQFAFLSVPAKMAMLVSLANYLIFFVPSYFRVQHERVQNADRLRKFQADTPETIHHCAKCGCTELTAPDVEFRVAADGEEYCSEHLSGISADKLTAGA